MNPNKTDAPGKPFEKQRLILHGTYLITVFILTLTGFGQMPIFKRYYIADIPGLGWLAKFYVTHYMHYLFAILLVAFIAYVIFDYLLLYRKKRKITVLGYIRGVLIAGLVITGVLLVIRNFTGYRFHPDFIVFLDVAHLGLVMALLMVGLYCIIFKKSWMRVL